MAEEKKSLEEVYKDLYARAAKMPQEELKNVLACFEDQYYNGSDSVPDSVYDNVIDIYTRRFGKYFKIGAAPSGKNKVRLPIFMGSLDKVKDERKLRLWTTKTSCGKYVFSKKVDGISSLLVIESGTPKRLYTRGNGKVGQDISVILKDLKIPEEFKGDFMVRGELVMYTKDFEPLKEKYANARNLASGIVNSKTYEKELVKKLHFIAYTLYDDSEAPPSEQFKKLSDMGFRTPFISTYKGKLTVEKLTDLFNEQKEKAKYEMDGIVVGCDEYHEEPEDENPEYTIAFKTQSATAETVVEEIVWEATKYGVLKPVARVEPVVLSGATISRTTAFNAKYVVDNSLGPGARITLIRSGEVIPYIVAVLEGADEPQLPDVSFHWNETGVDILLDDASEDIQVSVKKIVSFFEKLGMKSLGEKTVEKIYNLGYHTVEEFVRLEPEDIMTTGIGNTLAEKIINGIRHAIKDAKMVTLMAASGEFGFGFGERKISPIMDEYPEILEVYREEDKDEWIDKIQSLKGYKTTAATFLDGIPKFLDFLERIPEISFVTSPERRKDHALSGKKICFSGFRDKALEDKVDSMGGKVTTSVSGQTNYLVMKKTGTGSAKEVKAEENGIPIFTKDEFIKKFFG